MQERCLDGQMVASLAQWLPSLKPAEDEHMDSLENFRKRFEALEQQTEPLQHHPQAVEAQTRVIAWRLLKPLPHGLYTLLAIGLVIGWLTPVAGHTISCGDTLGPGGRFLLEADLDCGEVSPALTVRDGAHLDLGGHTIRASTSFNSVILLVDGQGAVVMNGIVQDTLTGFLSGSGGAIGVTGEGGHTVRHVTAFGARAGIIVSSDHNRLLNNVATIRGINTAIIVGGNHNLLTSNWTAGDQIGFIIGGDHNRLVENTSAPLPPNFPPAHDGFLVGGNKNLLIRNNAIIDTRGFVISGDGNRLVGNLASGGLAGISVSGQETEIVRNTAVNNGSRDLADAHEDCDNNRWHQNVFRTSRAGATENPACIQ